MRALVSDQCRRQHARAPLALALALGFAAGACREEGAVGGDASQHLADEVAALTLAGPALTICQHTFADNNTGWRYRRWRESDCSAGLPPSHWVALGEARTSAGAPGQAQCSVGGVPIGGHYTHPQHVGATAGLITCTYVAPTHPDATLCTYHFASVGSDWRTRVWQASDCSNGLPAADWVAIGSAASGYGADAMTGCHWSGVSTGGHYINPSHIGSTNGLLRCLYVRPTAAGLTRCRHFSSTNATGWRTRTWQPGDCSNGLPAAGAAYHGEARNGTGTGDISECGFGSGMHYNNPSHGGSSSGEVTCLYQQPVCGDGVCQRGGTRTSLPPESCLSCPSDCGSCPSCSSVRHFRFTSRSDVALRCGANAAQAVFSAHIPDQGYAVGRVVAQIQSLTGGQIHYWNMRVQVGAGNSYALGDDVCQGATVTGKANLGYGHLSAASDLVEVLAYQGSSSCREGQLTVKAGAVLDVWVEDPAPHCQKQDIHFHSYYEDTDDPTVPGLTTYYDWNPYMSTIHRKHLLVTAPQESVLMMGVTEGTPHANPNTTCGSESPTATLVSELLVNGGIADQDIGVLPASQGMGHLVLHSEVKTLLPQGFHTVELRLGRNISSRTTTGGCCGDSSMAIVRRPP